MYLGFDTSNYTTSVALYDGDRIIQQKKLLTVKEGERGLRQSDAVFQHTVNLPQILNSLDYSDNEIKGVGVSTRPRNVDGSYMPCFLVGSCNAATVSKFCCVPQYNTSHQVGHILAALYSVGRLDLIKERFIAFHISGGTTEALLVEPDVNEIIKAKIIAESLDVKAGQIVDRAGVLMGLKFPCGAELDKLSQNSDKEFLYKPSMKGLNCSLSGIENKVKKMLEDGERCEEVAKFTVFSVSVTIREMLRRLKEKYGDLPVLFSGGVSSNSALRNIIKNEFEAYFAAPEFSCDNAAGVAIFAYLKDKDDSNNGFTS